MGHSLNHSSLKVFLRKESDPESPPEIRRFPINENFKSYVYLRDNLKNIFLNLKDQHFTIYWRDCEGDDIIISTDEQLEIALEETKHEMVRKLYVTLHSEKSAEYKKFNEQNSKKSKLHHTGVVCDGCNKDIWGFRYKCIQCIDYDLCGDCEAKGEHSEHCMIRIANPLQWKRHFGKRLAHHINKYMAKASHCSDKDETPKECPYKSSRAYARRHYESPSWLENLVQGLSDWTTMPGECPAKENLSKAEEAQEAGSSKPHTPPLKRASESHVEFIRNIRENIAQFLDPLGIDVNVQVKTDKPTTSDAAASASTPTNDNQSQTNTETSKFPGEGQKLVDNTNVPKPSAPEDIPSNNIRVEVPEKSPEPEGWTLINNEASVSSTSAAQSTTPAESTPKEQPAESQASPQGPTNQGMYPPLPPQFNYFYHSDPKIQEAVEKMMNMGFSNEGGWLTQLLIQKNGSISGALDVLHPAKH